MNNSNSTWLSWPEAPNIWGKPQVQAGLEDSPLPTRRLPGPNGCCPADAKTHLGLLLPERERLLLVQHPSNDHEAELASKLPVREGVRGTEGWDALREGGLEVHTGAGCPLSGERWRAMLSGPPWLTLLVIYFRSNKT